MKLKGIVGKRIVGIRQDLMNTAQPPYRRMEMVVHALILEDGTELVPITVETEHGEYAHDLAVSKPARGMKYEVINLASKKKTARVEWTGTLRECREMIGEQEYPQDYTTRPKL